MKKLFTLLLVALATQINFAQDSDFKKDVIKYIEVSGAASQFSMALDQIKTMIPEEKHEEFTKDFNNTLPSLYSNIADAYMEEFTHQDIKKILEFYNSEVGKKIQAKQDILMDKAMGAAEHWSMDLQLILMKYLEE